MPQQERRLLQIHSRQLSSCENLSYRALDVLQHPPAIGPQVSRKEHAEV